MSYSTIISLPGLTDFKVAGLAKKVDDSPTVRAEFARLIDATAPGEIDTDTRALARECPTRWGSEYKCLLTHFDLQIPVKQLTKSPELKLKAFVLTDAQWKLAKNVADILSVRLVPNSNLCL